MPGPLSGRGSTNNEPGYPHTFWNDFVRRDLIFGERLDPLTLTEVWGGVCLFGWRTIYSNCVE